MNSHRSKKLKKKENNNVLYKKKWELIILLVNNLFSIYVCIAVNYQIFQNKSLDC
jgi:hypothetical protein